ncbi:hypothetical protein C7271_08515 [filamentous cyanobacterium CCP5]|nr:hypothetical protein C7271_08515 [filamentous cyanobacterium CCP5]
MPENAAIANLFDPPQSAHQLTQAQPLGQDSILQNFLRLLAIHLGCRQIALYIQPHHGRRQVLKAGKLSQESLVKAIEAEASGRVFLGQKLPSTGLETETLLIKLDSDPDCPVLRCWLRPTPMLTLQLYLFNCDLKQLSGRQIQTLYYLSQQVIQYLSIYQEYNLFKQVLGPTPSRWSETGPEGPSTLHGNCRSCLTGMVETDRLALDRHTDFMDFVTALQSCMSFEDLRHLLSTNLPDLLPQSLGQVYLIGQSPQPLHLLAQWGKQGQPPALTKAKSDSLFIGSGRSSILGVIKLYWSGPIPMPTLAQYICEQLHPVIERIRLLQQLQDRAVHDPLTGLFNRRHLETLLDSFLGRGLSTDQQLALVLIDIDHFKQINDTYGHPAGDVVLQDFSVFLKGHVRPSDSICRYGGEEFCLVLPNTSLAVAQRRAEKIRHSLGYVFPSFQGQSLPQFTVSMGLAQAPIHGATRDELILSADRALYLAKRSGRDRVIDANQL